MALVRASTSAVCEYGHGPIHQAREHQALQEIVARSEGRRRAPADQKAIDRGRAKRAGGAKSLATNCPPCLTPGTNARSARRAPSLLLRRRPHSSFFGWTC